MNYPGTLCELYRHFVDLGLLLDLGQPSCVISDLIDPGVISHLKTSKGAVFPVFTKYRPVTFQ